MTQYSTPRHLPERGNHEFAKRLDTAVPKSPGLNQEVGWGLIHVSTSRTHVLMGQQDWPSVQWKTVEVLGGRARL